MPVMVDQLRKIVDEVCLELETNKREAKRDLDAAQAGFERRFNAMKRERDAWREAQEHWRDKAEKAMKAHDALLTVHTRLRDYCDDLEDELAVTKFKLTGKSDPTIPVEVKIGRHWTVKAGCRLSDLIAILESQGMGEN